MSLTTCKSSKWLDENTKMWELVYSMQDVMNEPCVAADGYTYDRRAIEDWFEEHNTSPMTDSPLLSKNLLPNYTLYTAIMEWRSRLK